MLVFVDWASICFIVFDLGAAFLPGPFDWFIAWSLSKSGSMGGECYHGGRKRDNINTFCLSSYCPLSPWEAAKKCCSSSWWCGFAEPAQWACCCSIQLIGGDHSVKHTCKDGFCLVTLKMHRFVWQYVVQTDPISFSFRWNRFVPKRSRKGTKKRFHCLHIAVELIVWWNFVKDFCRLVRSISSPLDLRLVKLGSFFNLESSTIKSYTYAPKRPTSEIQILIDSSWKTPLIPMLPKQPRFRNSCICRSCLKPPKRWQQLSVTKSKENCPLLNLKSWCQRFYIACFPKYHFYRCSTILGNTAPKVDFWEHP